MSGSETVRFKEGEKCIYLHHGGYLAGCVTSVEEQPELCVSSESEDADVSITYMVNFNDQNGKKRMMDQSFLLTEAEFLKAHKEYLEIYALFYGEAESSSVLSREEIGMQLISATSKILDKKTNNIKDREANLYYGCVYGLLIALGKAEGFMQTDNQLGYINQVILEIFPKETSKAKEGQMEPEGEDEL